MSLDSQSAHAAQLWPLEAVRAHLRAGFKIFPVFGLRFENGNLLCACEIRVRHELKLARIRSFRLAQRLLIPRSEVERLLATPRRTEAG